MLAHVYLFAFIYICSICSRSELSDSVFEATLIHQSFHLYSFVISHPNRKSLQFHSALRPELHSGDPSELCKSLVPAEALRGPSACRPQGPSHDQPIDPEIRQQPNRGYVDHGG